MGRPPLALPATIPPAGHGARPVTPRRRRFISPKPTPLLDFCGIVPRAGAGTNREGPRAREVFVMVRVLTLVAVAAALPSTAAAVVVRCDRGASLSRTLARLSKTAPAPV